MLETCDTSICKSSNLFKSCFESNIYPDEWKKTSVVQVHQNKTKKIDTYRLITPLAITAKTFKGLLYNFLYDVFIEND